MSSSSNVKLTQSAFRLRFVRDLLREAALMGVLLGSVVAIPLAFNALLGFVSVSASSQLIDADSVNDGTHELSTGGVVQFVEEGF